MAKKQSLLGNNRSGTSLVSASGNGDIEPIMFNYDYNEIDADVRDSVKTAVRRVKVHGREINARFGQIGEELAKIKDVLEHGQFADVIQSEFDMSPRQAQRMMLVHREYGDNPQMLEVFSGTALAQLAAPSTPEVVREEAEVAAANGEAWTKAETQERINQAKAPVIEDKDLAAAQDAGFRIEAQEREERIQNNAQHPTFVAPEVDSDIESAEDAGIEWRPTMTQGDITSRVNGKSMEHNVVLEAPDGTLMLVSLLISETHVVTMAGQKYAEDQ